MSATKEEEEIEREEAKCEGIDETSVFQIAPDAETP
jgi:hypothetical protein